MAVLTRGGNEADFDPNKMRQKEWGGVLDTKKVYYTFAPGDCRRMATHEEMTEMINESLGEIKEGFTEGVENAINTAHNSAEYATGQGNYAKDEGDYAKTQGDYAKAQGDAAKSIVNDNIATPTIPGNVRGGGDIVVDQTTGDMTAPTKLDKTGDSKDNIISFTESANDSDIASGDSHATLFGKILKSIKTLRTAIGTLTSLATTVKTNLVAAVNELKSRVDTSYSLTGGTYIPNNADLNAAVYRIPGNYYCDTNVGAATILNPPTTMLEAFVLRVYFGNGIGYPIQQIELFSVGAIYRRMYDGSVWKPWIKYLSTSDLANTDTVNDPNKALGANVGYALGQEIDVINTTKYNTYPTTGFASGETILGFTNACTVNTCKLIAGGNFPSDLPSDATSSEGFVEVLVGFGPRKTVRFTRYDGTAMYLRMNFGNSWFNEWKKVTLTTI